LTGKNIGSTDLTINGNEFSSKPYIHILR
jgi:hypothetical protein